MSRDIRPFDAALEALAERVYRGERLDEKDARVLYETDAIHRLGRLADAARRRRHGDRAYYNVNRHINPTNVCIFHCSFCAFARSFEGEDGAWSYSLDEILAKAEAAQREAGGRITEFHIVGGLHPDWPYERYLEILRVLRDAHPNVHLKAYTAVEVDHLATLSAKSYEAVLSDLLEAGLGSLPGGGAEIFAEEIRSRICADKVTAEKWLEIHRTAHRLGIHTNATMLYGHIERTEHKVDHLMRLRAAQDEALSEGKGRFQTFIPLAFHPKGTELAETAGTDRARFGPTGLEDLREIAVARLVLDNFDHVKTYWVQVGVGLAQTALLYGADDIDGTVIEETIYHMAGSEAPQGLTQEALLHLIRRAGLSPVERDSLYRARASDETEAVRG